MLQYFLPDIIEAGCDEAGRGCLAGPVACAAVILPPELIIPELNDSKQLSAKKREKLRPIIESQAIAWAVVMVNPQEIDEINILQASITGMHRALDALSVEPQHIIVDGNKFRPYKEIPYNTIVKGDAKYASIAAASILAKTHRDEYMAKLAKDFPYYDWEINAGYPTKKHLQALEAHGLTPHHRLSYGPCKRILQLNEL